MRTFQAQCQCKCQMQCQCQCHFGSPTPKPSPEAICLSGANASANSNKTPATPSSALSNHPCARGGRDLIKSVRFSVYNSTLDVRAAPLLYSETRRSKVTSVSYF